VADSTAAAVAAASRACTNYQAASKYRSELQGEGLCSTFSVVAMVGTRVFSE
jgi:hypothetical protein